MSSGVEQLHEVLRGLLEGIGLDHHFYPDPGRRGRPRHDSRCDGNGDAVEPTRSVRTTVVRNR